MRTENLATVHPAVTAHAAPPIVLVVDDEAPVRALLSRTLRTEGYAVLTANDGQEALDLMAVQKVDAVVADISMPRMGGMEMLQRLRKRGDQVPVILLTGGATVETAVQAVQWRAFMYLQKPADYEVLSHVGRDALKPRARASLPGPAEDARALAADNALLTRTLDKMWLAFQPIVTSFGTHVVGYEALLRSDELEARHPGIILPLVERTERIMELGRRVREAAARAVQTVVPPGAALFVNLHPKDLDDPQLFEPDAPLSRVAHHVVLEITERSSVEDLGDLSERLSLLRRAGYKLAVDDVGSGYSALDSIAVLHPDIVKVDMSMVRDIDTDDVRQELVGSVLNACDHLRIRAVAEGVETELEANTLRGLRCELFQGFLFGRPARHPMPVAAR